MPGKAPSPLERIAGLAGSNGMSVDEAAVQLPSELGLPGCCQPNKNIAELYGHDAYSPNLHFVPPGLFIARDGLTWGVFLANNLLPVTLGNLLGGAGMIGLIYHVIYRRGRRESS